MITLNMNLAKTIAVRLQEVYLDGRWVAFTNYKKELSDVTKEMALKQVGDLNTIAKLVYHVNYYLGGLIDVLDGGPLAISDKYSFDVPPIESEKDWQKLCNDLFNNAEIFVGQVKNLTDEEIYGPFVDAKYGSYLRNLEGLIEHSYYHLGQIVMIRKLIVSSEV